MLFYLCEEVQLQSELEDDRACQFWVNKNLKLAIKSITFEGATMFPTLKLNNIRLLLQFLKDCKSPHLPWFS